MNQSPQQVQQLYQGALQAVLNQGTSEAWFHLGQVLLDHLRRWPAAAAAFARAAELAQDREPLYQAQCLTNLGWCRHLTGRSDAAAGPLHKAVTLAPHEGKPQALLSQVLLTLDCPALALAAAERAVALEAAPVNRVAFAFALAAAGQWDAAWREYEHRIDYKLPQFRSRPMRMWRGERVGSLYLEAEQGLGDAVFALRYLGEAARRAERVTLYVHGPLWPLLKDQETLPRNVDVLPLPQQALPAAEAWCPLLSLPVALEDTTPRYPAQPYLSSIHRTAPAMLGGERQVGIAWAGNPEHEQAHHRDCHLAYWLPLAEVAEVRLHSLQFGTGTEQQQELLSYGLVHDHSGEITSLADTARLIAACDLVISVDTAVAHLAGAMGKPCWLLVNKRGADFRWLRDDENTAWYPDHRLFWREVTEQWGEVMARVADALRRLP